LLALIGLAAAACDPMAQGDPAGSSDARALPVPPWSEGGMAPSANAMDATMPSPQDGGPEDPGHTGPDGAKDASDPSPADAGAPTPQSCALPSSFVWEGAGPLAQPKNGWLSMKDVSHVFHDGRHILYFTTYASSWGSGMMTFADWPDAADAAQIPTTFGVAPTLFYFRPKRLWVIAYQWGPQKFSYRTSSDPTVPSGWSAAKSLYNTALPPNGTGPIDQTVICDASKCYLYYAGDNGHIYKSSMPIGNFPGEFPPAQDSGIAGTAQNLFEAVQVYKLDGSNQYLMIVEAQGSARYFRAWTSASLDGPWLLLSDEFAMRKNVRLSTDWTNDVSHGDLVRSRPDETFPVDPCHLQMVFQGRDPNANVDYGRLPYRLGLISLSPG